LVDVQDLVFVYAKHRARVKVPQRTIKTANQCHYFTAAETMRSGVYSAAILRQRLRSRGGAITTPTTSISNSSSKLRTSSSSNIPPKQQQPKQQQYSLALVRRVPVSFPNAITTFAKRSSHIDFDATVQQHHVYLEALRKFVPTICLPALDEMPDSLFIEDTVVAIGNKAVVTHLGHPARRKEVDSIREFLVEQLGMTVTTMMSPSDDQEVFCDGGDVLMTSRHLFVGLSERTTLESVRILEGALEREAIPVPFRGDALHLKSIVTPVDDFTLLAPMGPLGDDVLQTMKAVERGYTVIRLPNMVACNVVSVNGGLLAQDVGNKEIRSILEQVALDRNMTIEFINCSEIAKADASLTCCSVLLNI
jgi:dimethylargininase